MINFLIFVFVLELLKSTSISNGVINFITFVFGFRTIEIYKYLKRKICV